MNNRKTIEEVKTTSRNFGKLLKKWLWANTKYSRFWEWRDVPWWYGERTAVGFLAAAVWLSGGVALEEYRTKKKKGNGRCDIHFRLSDRARSSYIAEAKKIAISLDDWSKDAAKKINDAIVLSFSDAENLTENEHKLGIAFVSFHFRASGEFGDPTSAIKKCAAKLKSNRFRRNYHHAAWIFRLRKVKKGGNFVVGMGVFIKESPRCSTNVS